MENNQTSEEKFVYAGCSSHCGGGCLLKVWTKDGKITRIETDDSEEPQLRACLRGRAYRQRVYDPLRIKYPLKRVGARGEGKFERISWDEALDFVANETKRIRAAYDSSAIMYMYGGGDTLTLHGTQLILDVFNRTGGCTQFWGHQSFEGAWYSSLVSYGTLVSIGDGDDFLNSKRIILWGFNPGNSINRTNTMYYLLKARDKGIPITVVDTRYTITAAALADQWIPCRPGTDAAMLIAMAYVIVSENLHNKEYIDKYTFGFEQWWKYLSGEEDGVVKTPEWAEKITGVPAATITQLARDYASAKPAALVCGTGPGRTASGERYHRAAEGLQATTGNVGIHGGYAGRYHDGSKAWGGFDFKLGRLPLYGKNPVDETMPKRRTAMIAMPGEDSLARLHFSEVQDAILKGKAAGFPAEPKMIVVAMTNPVGQFPNTNKWVQAMNKLETVVVFEQVMNATARYADVILPVATFLERNDMKCGGATPYYTATNQAIEPLYESKSPLGIAIELGKRFGINVWNQKTEIEWLQELTKGSYIPDFDEWRKKGVYKHKLPEPKVGFKAQIDDIEHNPFPTPSGKIEIYSNKLAEFNDPSLPPVPKYLPFDEGPDSPLREKYPLQLMTTHFLRRAHSQYDSLPWLRELIPQALTMNSIDAQSRGIKDGDPVRVFNDRGEVIIPASVTDRIMPGVVDLPQGGWYAPDKNGVDHGGCANVLTLDSGTPGGAAKHNSSLVQVEKAA